MLTVLLALARRRWLGQVARLGMEGPAYLRFAYMGAGLESGFFDIMRDRPGTAEELGRALGIAPGMESALESWLDAGAAFGVLKESRGVYSLGKRAASLLEEGNDPFRAFYLEGIGLDHDLLVGAPRRLLSGERLAASDLDGSVIARASRRR